MVGGSLLADPPQLTSGDGMSSEDGYVGQLPGHVAAPLVHGGLNPIVGGASADTRLAGTISATAEHPVQDHPHRSEPERKCS